MIDIPTALQAKLAEGVTTLAWCWVLTRRDGSSYGFTDHDEPLVVAGASCEPNTGFSPGDHQSPGDFAPTRATVYGVVDSTTIAASDVDNGLWDQARVKVLRVDWTEPELYFTAFTGELGAIRRTDSAFEAEISGLGARLDRQIGSVFARSCDAELGDERCGVDLQAGHQLDAIIVDAPSPGLVEVSGASGEPEDWFSFGVCDWVTGDNTGAKARITRHTMRGDRAFLEIDPAPALPLQPGDEVRLTVGCDKQFPTCVSKFANGANFRGCPHMPGNDVLARPVTSELHQDGRARTYPYE